MELHAREGWKRLGVSTRREVLLLASAGKQHPDRKVADAAAAWAYDRGWNRWANRLPGWILPAAGLVAVLASFAVQVPLIGVLGGLAALSGLIGWVGTSTARTLRRVYDRPEV